jgi:hypothetical protein
MLPFSLRLGCGFVRFVFSMVVVYQIRRPLQVTEVTYFHGSSALPFVPVSCTTSTSLGPRHDCLLFAVVIRVLRYCGLKSYGFIFRAKVAAADVLDAVAIFVAHNVAILGKMWILLTAPI